MEFLRIAHENVLYSEVANCRVFTLNQPPNGRLRPTRGRKRPMPFAKTKAIPKRGQKVYVPPADLCTVSSVDFRDGIYWVQIIELPGANFNWNFLMEGQAKWAEAEASSPAGGGQGG